MRVTCSALLLANRPQPRVDRVLEADPGFRAGVTQLVEAIPAEQRAAIQQIANGIGNQNITIQAAGCGNQLTIGP
jgi:hypothetical protein